MGQEAKGWVQYRGGRSEGKALLETGELLFRGETRLKVPLTEVREAAAAAGELFVRWGDEEAVFELGSPTAEKWAKRILNPRSLLDKLGVKAGQRVLLVGRFEKDFIAALRESGADVSAAERDENDVIFLEASTCEDLSQLTPLQRLLKRSGAIWSVRPRGSNAITERDVMDGAKAAGLVDVKVARFSETHTAEKLVIPVARR
jgi:hypothetical protein